ncbi:MAG: repeat-containing protein, partial [Herbinix sp.]|nr:repeat-containing protein [Herbinix sp.]
MKKRNFTLISIILLILIIVLAVVIFVTVDKKKDINTSTDPNSTTTISPSQSPQATVSPTPNDNSEAVLQLYPAPKLINNETKYGYIDATGKFTLEPAFDTASDFNDGAAIVTMDSKYYIIDEDGNVLYINEGPINDYRNGYAVFAKVNADGSYTYGYLDTKGKVVIEPVFTQASNFTKDGKAYVSKGNGLYEQIDKAGTLVESYDLGSKYNYAISIEDGYLVYPDSDSNTVGVITMKGEDIFLPKYSDIVYLGNDLFGMKKPGLESYEESMVAEQAIFNVTGEQLSDYVYYDLGNYYNGYSSATNDESTFFVGTDGKIVANLPKFEGRGT